MPLPHQSLSESVIPEAEPEAEGSRGAGPSSASSRHHIRGSALLFLGRLIALAVNFLTQVLTVRYLAKADYGALAYALTIASTGSTVVLLGMNRGVSRFLPIYEERGDFGAVFGGALLAFGTVISLGGALVVTTLGFRGVFLETSFADPTALALVVILIALAPLQALDALFQALLAVFAKPRAIFVRRFLVGPGLKLAAIVTVLLLHGEVELLAVCHLVAGGLGVALYVWLLVHVVRQRGLWERIRAQRLRVPRREMLRFTLPLLSTDVVLVLRSLLPIFLLGLYGSSEAVAEYRAVLPVAALNLVVLQSMKFLFVPAAARLYARDEHSGLGELFWRTAVWIAVCTFPVFGVTLFLADPVTELLFGERYASAGGILAVLAVGHYANAALGLNTFTLQVYHRVRALVIMDILVTAAAIALNVVLIRSHGALGAAWATTGMFLLHNLLAHVILFRRTPVAATRAGYLLVYGRVALAALLLELLRRFGPSETPFLAFGVLVASFAVARSSRRALDLAGTFPEIARLPLIGRILGLPPR